LIPIMPAAVADEDTPHAFYLPDKIGAFHPTASSPYRRA
jgi:hypothetical protein